MHPILVYSGQCTKNMKSAKNIKSDRQPRIVVPDSMGCDREGLLPRSHKMTVFNLGDLEHTHSAGIYKVGREDRK